MELLNHIVKKGGPETTEEMNYLTQSISDIYYKRSRIAVSDIIEIMKNSLAGDTLQGMAYRKPRGYAGDFEIIDKIYSRHLSPDPNLKNWDVYFHEQSAPKAVRNRKKYFKSILGRLESDESGSDGYGVLNIGSGPCRDILEYLNERPDSKVQFDCVDMDIDAIAFAKTICNKYLDKIHFENKNIFKYSAPISYNLIWSAGLFDYFTDRQFIRLVEKLWQSVEKNGRIVIGNFSENNDSRPYMELVGKWMLRHRSEETLIDLVKRADIDPSEVYVESEAEKVNLFLHVIK